MKSSESEMGLPSNRATRAVFPPCAKTAALVEAVAEVAESATSGDVALLSLAPSSFDQIRSSQHRREVLRQAVKSICRGVHAGIPNIIGKSVTTRRELKPKYDEFAAGLFEGKSRSATN